MRWWQPALGRNLAAGANGTAPFELIAPGTRCGDRLHQIDARPGKTFRVGRARYQGQCDFHNLLDSGPVTSINTRYGPAWLSPTSILGGRLMKVGVQINY